jgi:hypothetical protein
MGCPNGAWYHQRQPRFPPVPATGRRYTTGQERSRAPAPAPLSAGVPLRCSVEQRTDYLSEPVPRPV